MDFFVVFSGSWCATVPESWINLTDNTIAWPPKKINATKACKNNYSPKSSWHVSKYNKLLGPYDNYDMARAVEIATVDMSTCDESTAHQIINPINPPKRQRKKPARFQDSFSSSADTDKNSDSDHDEGLGLDNLTKPTFPSFHYSGDNEIEKQDDLLDTQELDYGTFFDEPPHPDFQKKPSDKPTIRSIESIDEDRKKMKESSQSSSCNQNINLSSKLVLASTVKLNNNLKKPNSPDENGPRTDLSSTMKESTNSRTISRSPVLQLINEADSLIKEPLICTHSCCPACRSVLNSVSRRLDILLNISADNSQLSTTKQLNTLPDFPICNHEDLVKFNNLLTNSEVARVQYEDLIKQRRVLDGKKFIRNVLGHILMDELCCKLSWSGQKKTIKVEDMSFVKYLKSTVIASNPRCSLDDCKNAIMSWLQHSNDRIKKIEDKHNKNSQ